MTDRLAGDNVTEGFIYQPGRCPECVKEGERSRVEVPMGGATTAMYCAPFYDEDGVYHHHDMNSSSSKWSCSRGHKWIVVTQPACPASTCSWSGSREIRMGW